MHPSKRIRKQYRHNLIELNECPKCHQHSLIPCPVNRNVVTVDYYCPFCNKVFLIKFEEINPRKYKIIKPESNLAHLAHFSESFIN